MDNKKSRLALIGVLAIAVLGATAYFAYDLFESRREAAAAEARAAVRATEERSKKQAKADRERQIRAFKNLALSPWLEQGLAPLQSALTRSNAHVLVLPPSNPEDKAGLDHSARIAFARTLADDLTTPNAALIPDPGFVARALGEPRTIDEQAVLKLVRPTHIESIISGSVGVQAGAIALKLERIDVQTMQRRSFEKTVDIAIPDRPEASLASVAIDAIRALGFDNARRDKTLAKAPPSLAMPSSPLVTISERSDPVTGLWLQQLFGALHSPIFLADPRAQERIFERTLWSLSNIDSDSADHAVLGARALSYLGRRASALRLLDRASTSPESTALRAYLNADLPQLKRAVSNIRRPIARLISELELIHVRRAAADLNRESLHAETDRITRTLPKSWHALVAMHGLGFDAWDYPSPMVVKGLLERDFPVPDYRAQDVIVGKAALGANPYDPKIQAEFALSPLVHVRKWREQHLDELCCVIAASREHRPSLTDYLDLLENSADALILGQIYFLRVVQGNRDAALATIKLYDETLFGGGHPGVLLQKAEGYQRTSAYPPSAWSDTEVFEAARRVMAWTPYQAYASAWAAHNWYQGAQRVAMSRGYPALLSQVAEPGDQQPLARDWPAREAFLVKLTHGVDATSKPAIKDALRNACAITTYYFAPCAEYVRLVRKEGQKQESEQIEALLHGRFAGYADAAVITADYMADQGRMSEAKAVLRDALEVSPSPQVYTRLGGLLSDEGELDEAARVYSSLPDLKRPGANTVGLSNYLMSAARPLLVRGAGTAARPLVERAASYRDGSYNNLEAQARVAIWQNDGDLALQGLRAMFQHYSQDETLGAIAALTFALGNQEAAWKIVKAPAQNRSFSRFAAAVVGLRRERAGVAQVLTCAESMGGKPYFLTVPSAFRVLAIDRKGESVEKIFEAERALRLKDSGNSSFPDTSGAYYAMTAEDNAVALQGAARGYRDLLGGNYSGAADALYSLIELFDKTGRPQGFEGPSNFWSMLPYTAYALVKAERQDEAAKLLERFSEEYQRAAGRQKIFVKKPPEFESHLVKAVIAATSGNHAQGLRELRLAQAQLEREDGPLLLIPQTYQFAEIAEWLGRDTRNSAYSAIALNYARAFRLYEPWTAWTYAFEAAYSKDESARLRAAATAMWLDPDSRRLQALPEALRSQAKQWLERHAPFRKARGEMREEKA